MTDPLLKRRRVYINQEVGEMRKRLSCGVGGGSDHGSVPCVGDGLVFWCRADHAIVEWRVEQRDLWYSREREGKGTHHELPTDFLNVPIACGVESSGSLCGDRRK
jgi:hypothetical protein